MPSPVIEFAGRGVRVNAVAWNHQAADVSEATHAAPATLHPVGRMGKVTDIVEAVLYLETAPFVSAETFHVDGGQHAGRW